MRYITVDRLLELEPGKLARGLRNVTLTEDVFSTHFQNFPVLPGVLVTDTMSEIAAWGCASRYGLEKKARLVALRGAKFRKYVRPGDRLMVEADYVRSEAGREIWKARTKVDGKLIATIQELEFNLEDLAPEDISEERRRLALCHRGPLPQASVNILRDRASPAAVN